MNEWLKEEAGWYTHPIYGGVCKEKNGWYAYPMRYDSDVSMGPYRTLAIAKDKIEGVIKKEGKKCLNYHQPSGRCGN